MRCTQKRAMPRRWQRIELRGSFERRYGSCRRNSEVSEDTENVPHVLGVRIGLHVQEEKQRGNFDFQRYCGFKTILHPGLSQWQ